LIDTISYEDGVTITYRADGIYPLDSGKKRQPVDPVKKHQ